MSAAILNPQAAGLRCTVVHLLLSDMLYSTQSWFAVRCCAFHPQYECVKSC